MKRLLKSSITLLLFICFIPLINYCKKEEFPTLTTSAIINITSSAATGGGTIISEGTGTIIAHGVCWSSGTSPSIKDNKTNDGAGAGTFTSNLSGLNGGTEYFVRAYATNSTGTGYGMAMSFKTLGQPPTATSQPVTNVTTNSCTLNGTVNANYLSTIVNFEYGLTTSYGQTTTSIQSPLTGNTDTNVSATLTGLSINTVYHFRVKTINSLGTIFSNDMAFKTLGDKPSTTTLDASNIRSSTATLNSTINANYLSTSVIFEYGPTTSYGSSSIPVQSPVNGNSDIVLSSDLTGLTPGTVYHFRVRAENQLGSSYGNDKTFTTPIIVTDIDGNLYQTVVIGTQTWMAENLKTTKFNSGIAIPLVTISSSWLSQTTSAYCWFNNTETSYKNSYGALYNWFTVSTGNLCPIGWHVPSDSEWIILASYLGGENVAGGKLKETGITHWNSPNIGANNESGFTGLPGGVRSTAGFYNLGSSGYWWSSTESNSEIALDRILKSSEGILTKGSHGKFMGFSVRCIKD
jgi:uncharacterized protein (TIGR02145 family)